MNADRDALARLLRRAPARHLYELGDLDEPFWQRTTWLTHADDGGKLDAAALVYDAPGVPVVIAMMAEGDAPFAALLTAHLDALPDPFYGHFTAPALAIAREHRVIADARPYLRMALAPEDLRLPDHGEDVISFGPADRARLEAFYAAHYPENHFDPWMLQFEGTYLGLERGGEVIGVAGVHVYAPAQGVAALGNIAIHPSWRGRGLGTALTGALCQRLFERVDLIGLNVREGNTPAQRCYARLGFEVTTRFFEFTTS